MKLLVTLLLAFVLLAACSFNLNSGPFLHSGGFPAPAVASTTTNEIDAIAGLSFDSDRERLLSNVAERPALTPVEQVHLVHTVMYRLDFDSSRQNVLKQLIRNPAFSQEAKDAIFADLPRMGFDSSKTEVLSEIQKHPVCVRPVNVESSSQPAPIAG